MTIGLLDTHIDALLHLKQWVSRCPAHDYVAYIETNEIHDFNKALRWFQEKGADIIAVGEGVPLYTIQSLQPHAEVIPVSDVPVLLEQERGGVKTSTVRAIHITQHSKEQDQKLALILGGYFIEE